MKYFTTFVFLCITTLSFSQSDFSKLTTSNDSTYGYTDMNPLRMKKGNNEKSIDYSIVFLKSLRTDDNQKLLLLQRYTVKDPGHNSSKTQLTNRSTGMPLNGKLGMLDLYQFVTSEKRDTVAIYVDIYNKGELKIPKGLKISDN